MSERGLSFPENWTRGLLLSNFLGNPSAEGEMEELGGLLLGGGGLRGRCRRVHVSAGIHNLVVARPPMLAAQ
jgi:hypothetical protein